MKRIFDDIHLLNQLRGLCAASGGLWRACINSSKCMFRLRNDLYCVAWGVKLY